MQLPLTLINDSLLIGRHTKISFNRTLRIPEDGKKYDLPAGFGRLPILRVEDVADRVPDKWRQEGGLIIPLYQREALFLEFGGEEWRPTIAKAAVGRVNAITGKPHDLDLKEGRQDYVVIPEQKWLDGINSGNGSVRQFIAMPLGQGYTVEAQITDEETHGGFQMAVFEPKEGIFIEEKADVWDDHTYVRDTNSVYARKPRFSDSSLSLLSRRAACPKELEMGIAAGGSIKQQILEDEYGIESWDPDACLALNIHIVNSAVYEEITGRPALLSPITAESYAKQGIPWFSHYDESRKSVSAPKIFSQLLSVLQIDKARGKMENATQKPMRVGPVIPIQTQTLVERIDELREKTNQSYAGERFEECLSYARVCGELLETQRDHLSAPNPVFSIEELAATAFTVAGECAARLGKLDDAEDFANRSLNLHFTERGLSLRLLARVQSKEWEDAEDDCLELLHRNPSHHYALQIQTLIAGRNRET